MLVPPDDVIWTREPVQHVADGSVCEREKKTFMTLTSLTVPVNHRCKTLMTVTVTVL
jgi:hypothetical protein